VSTDAVPPRIKTARRYRTIRIQADNQIITAADPLPDDSRQAIEAINLWPLTCALIWPKSGHTIASLIAAICQQFRVRGRLATGNGRKPRANVAEVIPRSHNETENVAMNLGDPVSGDFVHRHDEDWCGIPLGYSRILLRMRNHVLACDVSPRLFPTGLTHVTFLLSNRRGLFIPPGRLIGGDACRVRR
jgi:hypothetical protein